jgi:hypothetical protein
MRTCTDCGETKLLVDFTPAKSSIWPESSVAADSCRDPHGQLASVLLPMFA